jgi:hypothetical protein
MDVIDGYKGGADARLAVESGEVDGYCGSWGTVETVWRAAYDSKKIHPVLQASLKSHPKYKQIPLAINYAKSEEARELLVVADSAHSAQFPLLSPRAWPRIAWKYSREHSSEHSRIVISWLKPKGPSWTSIRWTVRP